MADHFASLDEALGWLDAHIDYERVAPTRRALPSLDGVRSALRLLGDPQEAYTSIHVTGTNGKGSTTAVIAAILSEAGLAVGTYTSPNLHRVNERIGRNLEAISDEELVDLLNRLATVEPQLDEPLTRFELLTVAALAHFADEAVDVAVVEVGLGGTWDSTNALDGDVAVITSVSLDHVQVLGTTPEEIAADKAGIIKPGATAVIGPVSESVAAVIERAVDDAGATMWRAGVDFDVERNRLAFGGRLVDVLIPGARYEDMLIPLHGAHQGENAAVGIAAVTAFLGRPLPEEIVEAGLGRVVVPGRLEVLGHVPLNIVDGAHNGAGAAALAGALEEGFHVSGTRVVVLGMLEGRDPEDLLAPLVAAGLRTVVCVAPATPRAMDPETIAVAARSLGASATVATSIEAGCTEATALAGADGLVLATGSLYVVGDARLALLRRIAEG